MAVTELYFGAASAGADDGTSWANRMAFVVSGAINTAISGFDFTSNSLIAYVGPGTHTLTTGIATFTGTTGPTIKFCCDFRAVLSDGTDWTPPDPDWNCCQPDWDDTDMPVIATTTNIGHGNTGCSFYGIKFTATGRTSASGMTGNMFGYDWCILDQQTANTAAVCVASTVQFITNTVLKCSGTSYDVVFTNSTVPVLISNLRISGNAAASSGNRRGLVASTNGSSYAHNMCIADHVGVGFTATSAGVNARLQLGKMTIANCLAGGISAASTSASGTNITNCFITGDGSAGYGITQTGTAPFLVNNTRIRDFSTGDTNGLTEYSVPPFRNNITTAGTDADEYVDAASGDYRIKNTSDYWGKNLGAGDQPAAGAGDYTFAQVKQLRYKMRQGALV